MKKEAYLVLDIGTGNVRSAILSTDGELLGVARSDIRYYRDESFPDSIFFKPAELAGQLRDLTSQALQQAGDVQLIAATSTSQREGIVLIDAEQKAFVGLPNIDHRGREWEKDFPNVDRIYHLTGRYPGSLFSVFKLLGTRHRHPDQWNKLDCFLSISDWALWELGGIAVYEHSQASETLLYDVEAGQWSDELCRMFDIPQRLLPSLSQAGTILGPVKEEQAGQWGLPSGMLLVTGGGDTQMAIKSTSPEVGDVVVVSGTTTPVVKIESSCIRDAAQRTWTSRDITPGRFVFEANAGVTGLNYQRLKEIFYPNEGYDVIERELKEGPEVYGMASLGSLIAGEKKPVLEGGFHFPVPVSHELRRSSFVWATLLDIAFSIAANYNVLADISSHHSNYIWACGGGMQSATLRSLIAAITGRQLWVRAGYEQASVRGAAILCNEALQRTVRFRQQEIDRSVPDATSVERYMALYKKWKETRELFRAAGQ